MTAATAAGTKNEKAFDLWAQVYDAQPNPLLALEERIMDSIMPLKPAHAMDIGCGTGRWLARLEARKPTSLIGVDSSRVMLERARTKLAPTTRLHFAENADLPAKDATQDLILCSFVLGYLPDLDYFAEECHRVLRPDGVLLLSDMHPKTAQERGWKRGFSLERKHIDLTVNYISIEMIAQIFSRYGLRAELLLEPCFEASEQAIFEEAGRRSDYLDLLNVPAIYILKLRKPVRKTSTLRRSADAVLRLANAPIARGPRSWREAVVNITRSNIQLIRGSGEYSASTLDLTGYAILPGLINAHDHLEFGLFPRLGRDIDAPPYKHASEWAEEIQLKHRSVIDLYRRIPLETRLWWAALRNVLCGAITVCHHNPMYTAFDHADFPVRVARGISWAHSFAFEPLLSQRYRDAPSERPFILHAAEGVDDDSRQEIVELDRLQMLDERTVLVHGLAMAASDIDLLNQRGSALITCPSSNHFLFHQLPSPFMLSAVRKLALGSDSSISGVGDLLDEVRCIHKTVGVDEESVYRMVTTNAAAILALPPGAGTISNNGHADLVVVPLCSATPAGTLCALNSHDVELVVRSGQVIVASPRLYEKLPERLRSGMHCMEVSGYRRWVRAPLQELCTDAEAILGRGSLSLSGKPVRYVNAL